jgi:hypothetical protein
LVDLRTLNQENIYEEDHWQAKNTILQDPSDFRTMDDHTQNIDEKAEEDGRRQAIYQLCVMTIERLIAGECLYHAVQQQV